MVFVLGISCLLAGNGYGQKLNLPIDQLLDMKNLKLDNILGKVLHVKQSFNPKFSLGNNPIPKIPQVESYSSYDKRL